MLFHILERGVTILPMSPFSCNLPCHIPLCFDRSSEFQELICTGRAQRAEQQSEGSILLEEMFKIPLVA